MRYHPRMMVKLGVGGRWMQRLIMIAVVGLVVGRCGEAPPPKRGPVAAGGRISQKGTVKLSASINCAVPGEDVVFDLTIMNGEPLPLTLLGTPLIDIAVHNTNQDIRWSQSSTYPHDITPILQPGEQRQYQWHWTALGFDGPVVANVLMTVQSPDTTIATASELVLPLGVNRIKWTSGGIPEEITCTELRE